MPSRLISNTIENHSDCTCFPPQKQSLQEYRCTIKIFLCNNLEPMSFSPSFYLYNWIYFSLSSKRVIITPEISSYNSGFTCYACVGHFSFHIRAVSLSSYRCRHEIYNYTHKAFTSMFSKSVATNFVGKIGFFIHLGFIGTSEILILFAQSIHLKQGYKGMFIVFLFITEQPLFPM